MLDLFAKNLVEAFRFFIWHTAVSKALCFLCFGTLEGSVPHAKDKLRNEKESGFPQRSGVKYRKI